MSPLDAATADADTAVTRRRVPAEWTSMLRRQELVLVPAIVVAIVVGALLSDVFLTKDNFVNILQQSSVLAVVVIAEALVLIVGKFDLSLESVVGFAPALAGYLMVSESAAGVGWELPAAVGIAVALLVGAAIGVINGMLIVKLRLNAFIVTLAMLILLRGVTLGITNGRTIYNLPDSFLYLGSASWLGVPASVWVAGLAFLGCGLFLRYHRVGRAMYAIGGNPESARAAGIRVDRVLLGTFVVAGLLAAVAGMMLTGRIASVPANQGQNLIFMVFAAAVIGGVSLDGGRGTMFGALTGVLLLGIIQNILTLSQLASFWIEAVFGAIILIALMIARFTAGQGEET